METGRLSFCVHCVFECVWVCVMRSSIFFCHHVCQEQQSVLINANGLCVYVCVSVSVHVLDQKKRFESFLPFCVWGNCYWWASPKQRAPCSFKGSAQRQCRLSFCQLIPLGILLYNTHTHTRTHIYAHRLYISLMAYEDFLPPEQDGNVRS